MWAYGEIGYHTGLMSRYSEFKSRYAYKRANFFFDIYVYRNHSLIIHESFYLKTFEIDIKKVNLFIFVLSHILIIIVFIKVFLSCYMFFNTMCININRRALPLCYMLINTTFIKTTRRTLI